jgi:hypothetical protein
MAVLSGNRIAWQYHSDDGNSYRVAAQKAMTDQAKLGGEAWAGVVGPKPASMKMRRITVRSAAHGSRVVSVYGTDAGILVAGATINANAGGDSYAFTSDGNPIPEGHIRRSVTKQSA